MRFCPSAFLKLLSVAPQSLTTGRALLATGHRAAPDPAVPCSLVEMLLPLGFQDATQVRLFLNLFGHFSSVSLTLKHAVPYPHPLPPPGDLTQSQDFQCLLFAGDALPTSLPTPGLSGPVLGFSRRAPAGAWGPLACRPDSRCCSQACPASLAGPGDGRSMRSVVQETKAPSSLNPIFLRIPSTCPSDSTFKIHADI